MEKSLSQTDGGIWRTVAKYSDRNYLMCKVEADTVRYAPLLIHSFTLFAPRMDLKDMLFVHQYKNHKELSTVPERLRWCRLKRGLMQNDVAEKLGVSRAVYAGLETGSSDYYPKDLVDKLAEFFEIEAYDLLDDYNRFQYQGQGKILNEYRLSLGLNKKAFARLLGIEPHTLADWENDKKRMNIHSWNKYFKDILRV